MSLLRHLTGNLRLANTAWISVLAALALFEHCLVVVARQRAAHRNPAAMHGAGHAAAVLRAPAVLGRAALQLSCRFGAAHRAVAEQRAQLVGLRVVGQFVEAVLAVLAVLDQLVEGVDHVVVADHRHGRSLRSVRIRRRRRGGSRVGGVREGGNRRRATGRARARTQAAATRVQPQPSRLRVRKRQAAQAPGLPPPSPTRH